MAATAVLVSKSIHIMIGGDDLKELAEGRGITLPFSLKGQALTEPILRMYIFVDGLESFKNIMRLDQEARDKARAALPEWQPGYSNRKIRKGKGHGKG